MWQNLKNDLITRALCNGVFKSDIKGVVTTCFVGHSPKADLIELLVKDHKGAVQIRDRNCNFSFFKLLVVDNFRDRKCVTGVSWAKLDDLALRWPIFKVRSKVCHVND